MNIAFGFGIGVFVYYLYQKLENIHYQVDQLYQTVNEFEEEVEPSCSCPSEN